MNILLGEAEIYRIKELQEESRYPEMYAYLGDLVSAAAASTPDPAAREDHVALYTWLGTARSINANDGSKLSEIVRGRCGPLPYIKVFF